VLYKALLQCLRARQQTVVRIRERKQRHCIGRKIPAWLDSLGLADVAGEGYTAHFNGGSGWARYWTETVQELASSLLNSGYVSERMLEDFRTYYQDPHYWTCVITFTANSGRKLA
jgi:hypothetical protein